MGTTPLSTENMFHSRGRTMEKSGILIQIEKEVESSDGDLKYYFFSLEDAVAGVVVALQIVFGR